MDNSQNNQNQPQQPQVQQNSSMNSNLLPQNQLTAAQTQAEKNKIIKAQHAKKQKKHLMIGCFSVFLVVIVFFVIMLIVFLTQAKSGYANPFLQLLGISEENLVNSLLTLTNFGFGFFAFLAFIITIIGLFKLLIVKKEDVRGKRSGIVTMILGTIVFTALIFGWIASYLYLSGITPPKSGSNLPLEQQIITTPKDLTELVAPVTVSFDASQVDTPSNSSFVWDFGDGERGTGRVVSHKYISKSDSEDGRYIVTLTITSFSGTESSKQTAQLTVLIMNVKPTAEFKASVTEGQIPLEVSFDASKSIDPDGQIIAYEWDFDEDGEFDDAEGAKAKHTFDKAGTFIARLRLTDNNNEFSTAEQTIKVLSPERPSASITSNNKKATYYAGVSYIFSAEDSSSPFGAITKYNWEMGDGVEANTKTVVHEYKKTGSFTITLTVTDEQGESGETTLDIDVRPPEAAPDVAIKTLPALEEGQTVLTGAVPFKVFFDASSTTDQDNNIVDYRWDLNGDGQIDQTGKEVTYEYEEIGEYQAILYVTDADKNESQASIAIKVQEQGIRASLKASQIAGEVPLEVEFDATGSTYPGGEIVSYEWDFGDDTPLRIGEASITHTYTKVGEFIARVTANASDSSKSTAQLNIVVRAVSLTACYTPSKKQGDAPLTVTFNPSCSKGTISKYLWDFQGATSTERKPTYTFKNPGTYNVTLKVVDPDNVSAEFTDVIVVKGTKTN